jgi:hypothetical protein
VGTNQFVPGALERLKAFYDAGNEIVFTTQREEWMKNVPSVADKDDRMDLLEAACRLCIRLLYVERSLR